MAERPEFEQFDNPALAGLHPLARAQVCNTINTTLLAEVVEQAGGKVVLPPGFAKRAGAPKSVVSTRFLDDGSYELTIRPLTPDLNHAGAGTRWERMEGPRRGGQEPVLYEVVDCDGVMATLTRIREDGTEIPKQPHVVVKHDYLRRGLAGWKRWTPPLSVVEGLAGRAEDGPDA